ncbi:MAG TPA: hypothetical protein VIJ21_00640 [Solirubrobacterales bacterium]
MADHYYEMQHPVQLGPVTVWSTAQETKLGRALATAVSQGRSVELRQEGHSILVLVTAADDLGHVYEIKENGESDDIGTTEKGL